MRLIPILAGAALLGAVLSPGRAQPAPVAVVVDGTVSRGGSFDAARLARLPQQSLPVTYGTGGGVHGGRYQGVLLWDLLAQAAPIEQPAKNPGLLHTVLVTGRDGYAAAFSFGELDPGGAADPVLLAMQKGRLDLLVPGDHTGGRDVHDVALITVR